MSSLNPRPLWVPALGGQSDEYWFDVIDPDGKYKANAKHDGCINYYRGIDSPCDCEQIHICDIDAEIARLQALKAIAIEHFGERWEA